MESSEIELLKSLNESLLKRERQSKQNAEHFLGKLDRFSDLLKSYKTNQEMMKAKLRLATNDCRNPMLNDQDCLKNNDEENTNLATKQTGLVL